MTASKRIVGVDIRGTWAQVAAIDIVTLDHADRDPRVRHVTTDNGLPLELDAPNRSPLMDGDGLRIAYGGYVLVRAAQEACRLIRCSDKELLARVAWTLGARGVPLQVLAKGELLAPDDPAVVMIAEGLGAETELVHRAFEPERIREAPEPTEPEVEADGLGDGA